MSYLRLQRLEFVTLGSMEGKYTKMNIFIYEKGNKMVGIMTLGNDFLVTISKT